jgi:serine protease inhibitor
MCALALGACAGEGAPVKTIPPGGDRSEHGLQMGSGVRQAVALKEAGAVDPVVAATWRAGFAALASSDDPSGAAVSPASLVVALAMLGEGATGDSVTAFDHALGASGRARTDAVNALTAALARYEGDPAAVQAKDLPDTPVVHLANQLVADDGVTVAEQFLDTLVKGYGAGVLVTDLKSRAGMPALDAWVNRNSGGLIKKTAIQPDPSLVLVLQNAIALAAKWWSPFDPNDTTDRTFTLASGEQVLVPTMDQIGTFTYAEKDGWRALRLPYTADLHADIILPPEGSAAAKDPATADPATVAKLTAALDLPTPAGFEYEVALPKLDLTTKVDLRSTMTAIGLGRLLDAGTADLGGLLVDPPGPPYLAQAWQQAVLKVDEQGTRAAAVTEFGIAASSGRIGTPQPFLVDRPFLLVVGDGQTGWPLFLASVLDPRG